MPDVPSGGAPARSGDLGGLLAQCRRPHLVGVGGTGMNSLATLLRELGKDVTYYENVEGGHGGAATNAQAAHMTALAYTFLWHRLGGGVPPR